MKTKYLAWRVPHVSALLRSISMDHMESVVDCKVVVVCEQCKECLCITQLTNTVGCIFDLNVFLISEDTCVVVTKYIYLLSSW